MRRKITPPPTPPIRAAKAYIALGSNLGRRRANIERALKALGALGKVGKISPFFETAPVGYAKQSNFLNAALELRTALAPLGLLRELKAIERALGRTKTFKNGPRVIDLDIIFYGDTVLKTRGLQIPHPRAHKRTFVLQPLAAIAPRKIHPVLGMSVGRLLKELGN